MGKCLLGTGKKASSFLLYKRRSRYAPRRLGRRHSAESMKKLLGNQKITPQKTGKKGYKTIFLWDQERSTEALT